jgi:hypothetical protein
VHLDRSDSVGRRTDTVCIVAMIVEDWAARVDRHFGFLKEHGFRVEAALGFSSGWCTRVVYVSETSAIAVDRNTDRRRAEVILAKLTEGTLPPWRTGYPLVPFDYVLLDSVVDARAPERQRWHSIPGKSYEEQVSFWAATLRSVAPEFLLGDLSAIEDGERAVRDSMARKTHVSEQERLTQGIATQHVLRNLKRKRDGS